MPGPPTDNQGGTAVGPPSFRTGPPASFPQRNIQRPPRLPSTGFPSRPLPGPARFSCSEADVEMPSSPSLWICAHASPLGGHDDPKDNLSCPRSEICQVVGNKPVDASSWRFEDKHTLYVFRDKRHRLRKEECEEGEEAKRDVVSWQEQVSVRNILGVSEMIEMKERDKALQC